MSEKEKERERGKRRERDRVRWGRKRDIYREKVREREK